MIARPYKKPIQNHHGSSILKKGLFSSYTHTGLVLVGWSSTKLKVNNMDYRHYGNTGCGVFKRGIQNSKVFWLKINIPKGSYWILGIGVLGRCQKMPKLDFQSQFSMSKIIRIIRIFLIFVSLKNTNLEALFCQWHFLIRSILKSLRY